RHQEYYNTWEFADVTAESPYDMETEENPFLHVTLHAVVENQIKQNDPPGVRIVLNQLTAKGHSQHEAVHEIARVLSRGNLANPEVLPSLRFGELRA
ncbi:hypothetical protein DRQ11_15260, partial [candidate division KSB1 bacterium]